MLIKLGDCPTLGKPNLGSESTYSIFYEREVVNTTMYSSEKILQIIQKEIKKQGISDIELANKAGCTARYILYLRKGERENIGIDYADRMLKALGVSVVLGQEREEP